MFPTILTNYVYWWFLLQLYKWEPVSYPKPPDKMSERLKEKFDPKLLYITCDGEVYIFVLISDLAIISSDFFFMRALEHLLNIRFR